MDIKAKITEIIEKVKSDPTLLADFKSDPIKAVEGIIGTDLPDEKIKEIIDGVKGGINLEGIAGSIGEKLKGGVEGAEDSIGDKIKEGISGIGEKLGGLFKKD